MSLRAQRNYCLLVLAGALWSLGVLWFPIRQWDKRVTNAKMDTIVNQPSFGWVELEELKDWKEHSVLLLIPGFLMMATGLGGTLAGLLVGRSHNGFRPSKGTHSVHA